MRALEALARLWRRSPDPHVVVATAYARALGRPLLVEPAIGEQLIAAWLSGSADVPRPLLADERTTVAGRSSGPAVLTISGPMVARPEPGLCDDGPISYEAIRNSFDAMLADNSVSAIVLRIESPGGDSSGCFDLADHIHESRGRKKIIAAVDDYAYSAGYALASACDQIWVTRTGGVGSIGCAAFHVDQTAFNSKAGLKVTTIYAGDHKVDFSPHQPLGDAAGKRLQAQVDKLRTMFVDSVARYRKMPASRVAATEALTYTGQAALDAGLADRIGTFRDVMASLGTRANAASTTGGKASATAGRANGEPTEAEMRASLNALRASMRAEGRSRGLSWWASTIRKFGGDVP